MYCLYNGEHGEHDLSFCPALDTTLRIQEEQYRQYVGTVVGDFTCLEVEYDWGRRDQRWKIQCNLCGAITYQYHTKDWRRGKGRATTCECRKTREIEKIAQERQSRKQKEKEALRKAKLEYVGKVYSGWKIIDLSSPSCCDIECVICGHKVNQCSVQQLIKGYRTPCKHPIDYTGDEWIGRKSKHLTVIGRQGKLFVAKCDCGNECVVRPQEVFEYKTKTCCGDQSCPYLSEAQKEAADRRASGTEYEKDIMRILLMKGYSVEKTKYSGDYGVDIIATDANGCRMAIQCKNHKHIMGVSAVQEVYAGGRFYDCTKFAVVSNSQFSSSAIDMAKKLGVYLSNGNFEYPKNIDKYCAALLPVHKGNEKRKKYYEINGEKHTLGDWCAIYGRSLTSVRNAINKGVSVENALKMQKRSISKPYTAFGYTGSLTELSEKYNTTPTLVKYRMKHRGMTLEQALTAPKMKGGQKKQSDESA